MDRVILLLRIFLMISLAVSGAISKDVTANHLLLFDSLPDGISAHKSVPLDIRTNFSGHVQLVESRDFRIVVNITAPTLQQAYDVNAEFFAYRDGVLLEIREEKAAAGIINLTWLVIAVIIFTLIVGIFTLVRAIQWYKLECKQYDFSERKSFASSSRASHSALYRSRNSIQMVALGQTGDGDHGKDHEFTRNLRCDEELRQVQEMPELEEAEALEMEQLSKLKLQQDSDMTADTEDSDPHERNLVKSKFNQQAKTIHKQLIRQSSGKKPSSRRTENGTYIGVPTEQEDLSEEDYDHIAARKDNKMLLNSRSRSSLSKDSQTKLNKKNNEGRMITFGKEPDSNTSDSEPAYANGDPQKFVLADVHKTNPKKGDNSADTTQKRAENLYVKSSELKPVVMSTFGQTSKPPRARNKDNKSDDKTGKELNTAHDNGQKYPLDSSWFAQTLSGMEDIAEDSKEDERSEISSNSKSIFGSSEIFDYSDTENTYFNLDSDIEVPPLDSEGFLSDGALPSPLGFPMKRGGEKGKVNDDIKLIPGALKSPVPKSPNILSGFKPRPNSSIIVRNDSISKARPEFSKSGRPAVLRASESPPLPPAPEQDGQPQDSVFQFPPPPALYKPPPHMKLSKDKFNGTGQPNGTSGGQSNGTSGQPNGTSGDYIQIKRPGPHQVSTSQKSRGKQGAALAPTYMNLTILSTLCVLTLATGVYSTMSKKEVKVEVTLFAPKHFFTNRTRLFFNYYKDTEALNAGKVLVYDMHNPLINRHKSQKNTCFNKTCSQGCDEQTGQCMCYKGYRLNENGKCVDVNECSSPDRFKCDSAAGCYNKKGSYECVCGEDYYSFGKTCRECSQPCPKDYYELQPCTRDKPKICDACTKICRPGYFIAQKCTKYKKDVCRVCRSPCEPWQYESRQCTNIHDRECKNSTELPSPQASKNVILEDRRRVRDDVIKLEKQFIRHVGIPKYTMKRGTGLYLELTVYYMDATQQYLPVNVTQPFNLDLEIPSVLRAYAVQRYCPVPIPDYYILKYKKHVGLTYKQNENGSLSACETNKQFGDFLQSGSTVEKSFLCSQPGSLSETFRVDESFFLARTKWVDKNRRCQRSGDTCQTCTSDCSTEMVKNPDCSISAHDDDGISPRLQTCYNCCVKKNCSKACEDYHKRKCQPEQCSKGNLLEFTIEPSYENSVENGNFFCHIEPQPKQKLVELEYSVLHDDLDSTLHSGRIKVTGNKQWEDTGILEMSDGILSIMVNSSLVKLPNFLEGSTSGDSFTFKVGSYTSHGTPLGTSAIRNDYAFIRPPTLKGVPSLSQSHQECTNTEFQDMLIASEMVNPYIQTLDHEAKAFNFTTPFKVFNKRKDPVVLAKLSKETPILKQMFPTTTLVPGSFSGNVTQANGQWMVKISAKVEGCPGYLHIKVQDPGYTSQSLFDCDLIITCPNDFSLTFTLPTSDRPGMFKDIIVVIQDKLKVYNERVFRRSNFEHQLGVAEQDPPAKNTKIKKPPRPYSLRVKIPEDKSEPRQTPDLPIPFPYLLTIAGTVILLLVLAVLGFCFQPGVPDTLYAKWYHPLFAMGYMMLQFVYSLVVTGTLFFLLLSIVTRKHVDFVVQYGSEGAVSQASSHIELLQLQRHLEAEIARQDAHIDEVQETCMVDVKVVVADLQKLHDKLVNATEDVFDRYRLELLLDQQKLHVRQRLTQDLKNFRDRYSTAAQAALRQVNQNVLASFQNVEKENFWLKGARFVWGSMNLRRELANFNKKDFMDWTGIKAELSKLEIDLSFSLPAFPRLNDIPSQPPVSPPVVRVVDTKNAEKKEDIRTIHVHNNWFFPLQDSAVGGASVFKSGNNDIPKTEVSETSSVFFIFLFLFIICDMILLAHRMCKAWTTAKLIIFGFPEYFRERKEDDQDNDDVFASKESRTRLGTKPTCRESHNFQAIKYFITQTISTTFFPKIVFAVAACVISFCILQLSNRYLTVEELGRVGFYHSADEFVDLQALMTNARIKTHAEHINTVDFPAFQATVNGHVTRHWTVLDLYHKHLTGLQKLSIDMYCQHLTAIGLKDSCPDKKTNDETDKIWRNMKSVSHACKFYPVVPRLFTRNVESRQPVSEVQLEALLESLRFIIYHTCQLVVIYLSIIVLKELMCAVIWILIQRSGIIRIRVIVEHDQDASIQ